MNHLCRDTCEACNANIVDEWLESPHHTSIFSVLLVNMDFDSGFQLNFSMSLCMSCGVDLIPTTRTTYIWRRCACCGEHVKRHDVAFRVVELEIEETEQHGSDEFISASTPKNEKGPVGYTVCVPCMVQHCKDNIDEGELRDMLAIAFDGGDMAKDTANAIDEVLDQ
jgi:hypothetical protein